MMSGNFRSAEMVEPRVFGGPGLHTPLGIVPQQLQAPALPPRPFGQQTAPAYGPYQSSAMGMFNGIGGGGMYGAAGGYGGAFGGGYGSPYGGGGGFGSGAYGGMGAYGGGGVGGGYGAMQPYGPNRYGGMDAEARFIQMAEESSRPAFQSIESLVAAIGNIAAMLDSTFFAITSSFRAILGVAANFGRLRGVFAQFWSTFALFRGLSWLYKKILYFLKLSNVDPSLVAMGEAFAAAQGPAGPINMADLPKGLSAWPIMVFLGFIFAGPYLIMKLIGSVSTAAIEESRNPRTWVNPIPAKVQHAFQATSAHELSIRPGQTVYIAPREVQNTHKLLNTGWLLASVDCTVSGIIPVNYIEHPSQRSAAWSEPAAAPAAEETATTPTTTPAPVFIEAKPLPPLFAGDVSSAFAAPAPKIEDVYDGDVKHTVSA